jgi:hypothetical protein
LIGDAVAAGEAASGHQRQGSETAAGVRSARPDDPASGRGEREITAIPLSFSSPRQRVAFKAEGLRDGSCEKVIPLRGAYTAKFQQ